MDKLVAVYPEKDESKHLVQVALDLSIAKIVKVLEANRGKATNNCVISPCHFKSINIQVLYDSNFQGY